ncbi:MAG TPA: RluA family pseudouridine synthase [Polyangiaceae bacterium]
MIVVPRARSGARLDRFLAEETGVSRSELQRWIAAGRVKVDGAPREASGRVKEGETVAVEPMAPPTTEAKAEEGIAFEVMHVDEAVVVVNKPAGLVVHPAKGHATGTLVNGLLARGYFAAGEEEHERPGIVHRLDKGTSGVMVVARTPQAREALVAQFRAHTIERAYRAVVAGVAKDATHATLHGRHPRDRLRFTTRVATGRRAVTHVRVLEALGAATLVECTLETGRTHQIRVHLAESGTPVLGDPLYGKPPRDPLLRAEADRLGHQALHARVLGFVHPTSGATERYVAEPPADFDRLLAALRERAHA